MEVEEPEDNAAPLPVTLLVQRGGGSTGVSQVDWIISRSDGQHQCFQYMCCSLACVGLSGSSVAEDIQPTSGTLHFISGLASRPLTISVLRDTTPEITEVRPFLITVWELVNYVTELTSYICVTVKVGIPEVSLLCATVAGSRYCWQQNVHPEHNK